MLDTIAAMATDEELANLQRLSNDYVPDVQVRHRISTADGGF